MILGCWKRCMLFIRKLLAWYLIILYNSQLWAHQCCRIWRVSLNDFCWHKAMTSGRRLASIFIIPLRLVQGDQCCVGIKPLPPLMLNEHCLPFLWLKTGHFRRINCYLSAKYIYNNGRMQQLHIKLSDHTLAVLLKVYFLVYAYIYCR